MSFAGLERVDRRSRLWAMAMAIDGVGESETPSRGWESMIGEMGWLV